MEEKTYKIPDTAHGVVSEPSPAYALHERLAELGKLPKGWDGEGSLPISSSILSFVSKVLGEVDGKLLENWVLFPNARGYLYWDFTKGKDIAGITIAPHKIVAFVKKSGQLNKFSFNELNVLDVIHVLEETYG